MQMIAFTELHAPCALQPDAQTLLLAQLLPRLLVAQHQRQQCAPVDADERQNCG